MGATLRQLSAMVRLVARGIAARGSEPEAPSVPRRRPSVERMVEPAAAARVSDWLRATGSAEAPSDTLPPLFAATWETHQALELLAALDPPLPLGAVVHRESEIVQVRPLPAGERIRCRVELERAEPSRRGLRLTVVSRNWNGAGQLCTEGTSVFVVKGGRRSPDASGERIEEPARPRLEPAHWEEAARWRLGSGAGRRYARASGDFNPIHLWGWTARPFGFRRPILHGWCTAARVSHALVELRLGGDSAALRRLAIHFRAPLPLPATVFLRLADTAREKRFRVTDEPGETIYAEGRWAGGPSLPLDRGGG